MTVPGVAPPAAAALASATQTNGAGDPAHVKHFDTLMGKPDQSQAATSPTSPTSSTSPAATQPASAIQSVQLHSAPDAIPGVQMTPAEASRSSLAERLRTYGNDLDQRYAGIEKHREQMLTSMPKLGQDPLMEMAQMMDFQWSASTTIAEYQLSMSVAQAVNGFSHSILKNQE
ncbi:hypothetical protein [Paraburkholderia lacunae]|uniref:Uncharacterized protein n=1 Tax=Paraburkholderia lacunae TaxID=2211104 RepID=A0A370MYF4_9BURK|nr:hypothetical protein [Paraburkholderia lacunae]RDJ98411.1 hypothetical protein DLM46_33685 [Paraburkholderia lacunae]